MKLFKYLLAISMIKIEFKGLETKTLKRYTSYDQTYESRRLRITRNRRNFDYDYEYWEKNMDSNNNIKLITRKYDAHDFVFNTVNAIYGILRENNNVTGFNKGTGDNNNKNTEPTLKSAYPTSGSKLTAMSSISESNTDLTATTSSVRLFKPDLTTLGNDLTSFSANDTTTLDQILIMSKIEPESTTITSISKETPTIDESISKFSTISTVSSNTGETTRDWRDIIDFTVLPEDTVADLLLLYANTTPHAPGTTLKPPPTVNPTEFLFTTKKFFDLTITTIVTKNPILVEIEEAIQKNKDGFFTSSLIVLLKTLVGKNVSDVDSLLHGVDIAIVSMSKDESLSMFNATALEVFQSAIQMLLVEPADVRNAHLTYATYALENRRTFLLADVNALLSVVDTVYTADDVINIADFIRDQVAGFPNNTKDPSSIARQAIELFIILPHLRVKGTAKEELLMMGLNAVIKSRMFAGQMDRRRAGDENISRQITGHRLWNKEVTKSLRHYPRRLNKMAKTTLLLTRDIWKHTSINNKKSMRKIKSLIDNDKLHSIKSTKPTYKLRRHHSNEQDFIDRKILVDNSKINAAETYKLKLKNTKKQAIAENTENISSAGQNSETSSREDTFDTYSKKRSITKNINQHKDPRLSICSNNHRKQNDNHSIQLKGLNYFNQNEKKSILNTPVKNNNIKDKLVDWMNKYTNVIYQKLKNENMHYRTRAYLRDAFKLIAKRKSYGSHGRKLNKNVFNTTQFNFGINDVVQKERKPMEVTSYENDEESILKFNILKSIRNTSSRSNSNLTNRKKLQDNEVIKAELIKLIRKNTNMISRKFNRNMAINTFIEMNRVRSKTKTMKESSYEIDDEINLKNKIFDAMKKDFKTAVENRKPIRRDRKTTVVYSIDDEKELKANLYALFRKNSRVSKHSKKIT